MLSQETRARNALFNVASLIFEVVRYQVKIRDCPHGNCRSTTRNAWYCVECFGALKDALDDVAALEPNQRPPLLRAWVPTAELAYARKWLALCTPVEVTLYPNADPHRVPVAIDRLDMRPLQ